MLPTSRFFQWIYRSFYFILYIILLGLLLITPADAIERSLKNGQIYNVWLLIIVSAVTILVICFVYFVRLYVNRTILASIPKTWMPIELGDVKKHVHAMIGEGLQRSALVAFEARPRIGGREGTQTAAGQLGVERDLQRKIWGGIEHKGWASPESPDLPNLQYTTVLAELPNLIEAKALTLAPPDPMVQGPPGSALDPEAVGLLQRPPNLSLRGYIDHLISLGVLAPGDPTNSFLQKYEGARFSTQPLSDAGFRELMHLFAELLRLMTSMDFSLLDADSASTLSGYGFDGRLGDEATGRSVRSRSPAGTVSTQDSVLRQTPLRSSSWAQYRTAPNTPLSRRAPTTSRYSPSHKSRRSSDSSSSRDTFAQTRRPYQLPDSSSSSGRSLRSESAGGSVIRLATSDDGEVLPYVLSLTRTRTTDSLGGV